MKINTFLDPACFVWSEEDFIANKFLYYDLIDEIIDLLTVLEEGQFNYIFSLEMIDYLTENFPVKVISEGIKKEGINEAISLFFSFISKMDESILELYNDPLEATSVPNLSKTHFSDPLNDEIEFLINYIATFPENLNFISLKGVWAEEVNSISIFEKSNSLILKSLEVLTDANAVEAELEKGEKFFEPSDKHKPKIGWGTILPDYLEEECYSLIKKSVKLNELSGAYYAYSEKYNEYVIFRLTVNNIFHAYPISEDEVPKKL